MTIRIFLRAEDGAQTRDPQLGRQQIYSLPHLATLVFALLFAFEILVLHLRRFVSQLRCKDTTIYLNSKQNRSFLLQ